MNRFYDKIVSTAQYFNDEPTGNRAFEGVVQLNATDATAKYNDDPHYTYDVLEQMSQIVVSNDSGHVATREKCRHEQYPREEVFEKVIWTPTWSSVQQIEKGRQLWSQVATWSWHTRYVALMGFVFRRLARTSIVWRHAKSEPAQNLIEEHMTVVASSSLPLCVRLWLVRALYDQLPTTPIPDEFAVTTMYPQTVTTIPKNDASMFHRWDILTQFELRETIDQKEMTQLTGYREGDEQLVSRYPSDSTWIPRELGVYPGKLWGYPSHRIPPTDMSSFALAEWYIHMAVWMAKIAMPLYLLRYRSNEHAWSDIVQHMHLLQTQFAEWLVGWPRHALIRVRLGSLDRSLSDIAQVVAKVNRDLGTGSPWPSDEEVERIANGLTPRTIDSNTQNRKYVNVEVANAIRVAGRAFHVGLYNTLGQMTRTLALFMHVMNVYFDS